MSQELIYTSAPRGLIAGTQGFCTVAATRGMSPPLMETLESLTGYKPLFPPHDPSARLNPVAFLHLPITVGGHKRHVVGRVGPAELDYTGRTNKLAHLFVLDNDELPRAGPAWLLQQPGFLDDRFEGKPRYLEQARPIPNGPVAKSIGGSWKQATGDAGWAGALAESYLTAPDKPMYLLFEPGQQTLPLIAEAMSLLPPADRWNVGFCTYYLNLPAAARCPWRCLPVVLPEAQALLRSDPGRAWVLSPALGRADGGQLVDSARAGTAPAFGNDSSDASTPRGAVPLEQRTFANANPGRPQSARPIPASRQRVPKGGVRPLPAASDGRSGLTMFVCGLTLGMVLMAVVVLSLETGFQTGLGQAFGLVARPASPTPTTGRNIPASAESASSDLPIGLREEEAEQPDLAIFCPDLVPDYPGANGAAAEAGKRELKLDDHRLGFETTEPIKLEMSYLAQTAVNDAGKTLKCTSTASGTRIELLFGEVDPIATFEVGDGRLRFNWKTINSTDPNLPDARAKIKQSVLTLVAGKQRLYLFFAAPSDLRKAMAEMKREQKEGSGDNRYYNEYTAVIQLPEDVTRFLNAPIAIHETRIKTAGKSSTLYRQDMGGQVFTSDQKLNKEREHEGDHVESTLKLSIQGEQPRLVLTVKQFSRKNADKPAIWKPGDLPSIERLVIVAKVKDAKVPIAEVKP